jgi:hypothetical protein
MLLRCHGLWLFGWRGACAAITAWCARLNSVAVQRWGVNMPGSEYYHRQADLCVRMALSAMTYEERLRLLDRANEYREKAAQAEVPSRTAIGHSGQFQNHRI